MSPLVSVIIPVYNGAAYLRDALESVLTQDYSNFEVIVADDGSTDDTASVASSFQQVNLIRLPNGGVSRARNLAIEQTQGEFIAFLDADDRWRPGKLSGQIGLAMERPDAGFVLCHEVHVFEGPVPEWFRGPLDGSPIVAYEPSAWLVRRSTLAAVGGFDEARSLGEDTEWLARAWDLGVGHVVHPATYVERRIHGSNATGTIPSHRRVVLDILRESVQRKRARPEPGG